MFKLGRLFEKRAKRADVAEFIKYEYGLELRSLVKNGIPQDVAIEGIRNRVKL